MRFHLPFVQEFIQYNISTVQLILNDLLNFKQQTQRVNNFFLFIELNFFFLIEMYTGGR